VRIVLVPFRVGQQGGQSSIESGILPGIIWMDQIKDIFLLGFGSDYTVPPALLELYRNGLGLPLDLAVVKNCVLNPFLQ
jgi:hypothetical protein